MTPNQIHALVLRSFRSEYKREPTKDEVITIMAGWLSAWSRKDDEETVARKEKPRDLETT